MEININCSPEELLYPTVHIYLPFDTMRQLNAQDTPNRELLQTALTEYLTTTDTEALQTLPYAPLQRSDCTQGATTMLCIEDMHDILTAAETIAKQQGDIHTTPKDALSFIANEALCATGIVQRPKQARVAAACATLFGKFRKS